MKQKQIDINSPPQPKGIPFLGNISVFFGKVPPYKILGDLSKTHGDVFQLKVGPQRLLILNSWQSVREAFVGKSVHFAGRPSIYSVTLLSRQNAGIVFSDYCERWKEYKKIGRQALHLFMRNKENGESLCESSIQGEVQGIIDIICAFNSNAVNPSDDFAAALMNTISMLTFSKRYERNHPELRSFMASNSKLKQIFKAGHPLDLFPALKIFPWPRLRLIQEIVDSRDAILNRKYLQHKATFEPAIIRDITDAYLKYSTDENCNTFSGGDSAGKSLSEDNVIMGMWEVFAGGFESTYQTLRYAIAILANNMNVQHRIQKEMDEALQHGNNPVWGDRKKLPYLMATVLESLRRSSFSSLNAPHRTTCETSVSGFNISRDVTVFCNLWFIHHDPRNWEKPFELHPEHFLDGNGDVFIPKYFMPFSAGARTCLGDKLAKMQLFLFLGGILRNFTIHPPSPDEEIDLNPPTTDPVRVLGEYKVIFKPCQCNHCNEE